MFHMDFYSQILILFMCLGIPIVFLFVLDEYSLTTFGSRELFSYYYQYISQLAHYIINIVYRLNAPLIGIITVGIICAIQKLGIITVR